VVFLRNAACGKRSAPAATDAQQISTADVTCSGGVYQAELEVPAGAGGVCYMVVIKLADGSVRRAVVKVA
jgi:hypothetical protein